MLRMVEGRDTCPSPKQRSVSFDIVDFPRPPSTLLQLVGNPRRDDIATGFARRIQFGYMPAHQFARLVTKYVFESTTRGDNDAIGSTNQADTAVYMFQHRRREPEF